MEKISTGDGAAYQGGSPKAQKLSQAGEVLIWCMCICMYSLINIDDNDNDNATVRYAEGKSYDYSKEPPMDTPAGHFTQMVLVSLWFYSNYHDFTQMVLIMKIIQYKWTPLPDILHKWYWYFHNFALIGEGVVVIILNVAVSIMIIN